MCLKHSSQPIWMKCVKGDEERIHQVFLFTNWSPNKPQPFVDPPDPPSSTSILLMRHRHRTIQAIAKQLNPALNGMSAPSTPLAMMGASVPSTPNPPLKSVSPISETELLNMEEGQPIRQKASTVSSIGQCRPLDLDELCLTSSSCGGSLKSDLDSPNWLSSPRKKSWSYARETQLEGMPEKRVQSADSGQSTSSSAIWTLATKKMPLGWTRKWLRGTYKMKFEDN